MSPSPKMHTQTRPILLFDNECGVCRRIARWVQMSAKTKYGEASIIETPIGADPAALRSLNPNLDIWEAYATIHLLMPDGSMKRGGEAVGEVLRNLRNTQWFTWTLAISIFGFRPFQMILNMAYVILAEVRPLFGCESCGAPNFWIRPIAWVIKSARALFGERRRPSPRPHFTALSSSAVASVIRH